MALELGVTLIAAGAWGTLTVAGLTLFYAHGERERELECAPRMTATCTDCGRLFHAETDRYMDAVLDGETLTCAGCPR